MTSSHNLSALNQLLEDASMQLSVAGLFAKLVVDDELIFTEEQHEPLRKVNNIINSLATILKHFQEGPNEED